MIGFVIKRLPVVIVLLLTACLMLVVLAQTLDFASTVTSEFEAGSAGNPFGGPITDTLPIGPDGPVYGAEYCERINDAGPGNPFRGYPTNNSGFHDTSYISALFCDPNYGQAWEHEGIDFAFYAGTQVVATADAQVAQLGYDDMLGNLVTICANGFCARYAHLDFISNDLVQGQMVPAGTVLGAVGASGNGAFGVHLHYDHYDASGFWDPFPTLGR